MMKKILEKTKILSLILITVIMIIPTLPLTKGDLTGSPLLTIPKNRNNRDNPGFYFVPYNPITVVGKFTHFAGAYAFDEGDSQAYTSIFDTAFSLQEDNNIFTGGENNPIHTYASIETNYGSGWANRVGKTDYTVSANRNVLSFSILSRAIVDTFASGVSASGGSNGECYRYDNPYDRGMYYISYYFSVEQTGHIYVYDATLKLEGSPLNLDPQNPNNIVPSNQINNNQAEQFVRDGDPRGPNGATYVISAHCVWGIYTSDGQREIVGSDQRVISADYPGISNYQPIDTYSGPTTVALEPGIYIFNVNYYHFDYLCSIVSDLNHPQTVLRHMSPLTQFGLVLEYVS